MADILLIHGACHGAWCWEDVATHLKEAGHRPLAIDLPCDDPVAGLADYAQAAVSLLPAMPNGLVVVAHSLGGLTAPVVAAQVRTRRLVFVNGVIGAPGKSLADLAAIDAGRDGELGEGDLEFQEAGLFRFSREGAMRTLFHDCQPELAELAYAKLRFQRSMWNEVAEFDDWKADEIVSVVSAEDRVVKSDWGRRVSKERLGVDAHELAGGHSPWLSQPAELAKILIA